MIRKIVKTLIPSQVFTSVEPYGHKAEAVLLNAANGFPGRKFKVIGVTGTNGKTSTAFMIHRMLVEAGYKVGLMTTVAYGAGREIHPQVHHMTSVSVPVLMKRFKWMAAHDVEWLILETTSHALAQSRVWGVPYSISVMTNLTHEHLDYHKTFENYRAAKVKMFEMTARNRGGQQIGVVNADDPSVQYFAKAVPNVISYGIKFGDLKASSVESKPTGNTYVAQYKDRTLKLHTNMPGMFNVYNSLAAAGVGLAIGLTDEQIEKGIAALEGVEGRMNAIDEGQDFSVIVDFAHTPDSFEQILSELRPMVKKRLIVVFGSAGRRDEAKRTIQGRIAGKWADQVIVTEEDDRDIDGQMIMNQIAEGAEAEGKVRDKNLFLVHDRTEAIKFAIEQAKTGDTVVFLGKGHEKTIERADGEHAWDEAGTVRKALRKRFKKA